MNRLTAARQLRNDHMVFQVHGTDIIVYHVTRDTGWEDAAPGFYAHIIRDRSKHPFTTTSPDPSDWWKVSAQTVLHMLREGWNRRQDFQCIHEYASGALCTSMSDEHRHRICHYTTTAPLSI